MDTALLLGAIIASLGIAAFGFLYFVSGNDSNDGYDAAERRKAMNLPPTKDKKPKEKKKNKRK